MVARRTDAASARAFFAELSTVGPLEGEDLVERLLRDQLRVDEELS